MRKGEEEGMNEEKRLHLLKKDRILLA